MMRILMFLVAAIIVQVDGQLEGEVRLMGGSESLEGRVEIFLSDAWGTVCDKSWDMADADVVCRQLGFPGALEAKEEAYFGEGSPDMEIWMAFVHCEGSESELSDCFQTGSPNFCSHLDDAGVVCSNSSDEQTEGDVRLIGGSSSLEGRVEFLHIGAWGTVCDSGWDIADAYVVCRQLGFPSALEAKEDAYFGQGSSDMIIWLAFVDCMGNETELSDCSHSWWGTGNCDHSKDAGVVCSNSPDRLIEGEVRLLGGSSSMEGRVEIFHAGEWGTVCDSGWGLPEADVVCRQLGFATGLDKHNAYFGQGNTYMETWLSGVDCSGSELELSNCSHSGWGVGNCGHGDDAGVICSDLIDGQIEGDVRLIGGSSPLEGRVEIFHEGLWGTVCDNLWDLADADVVCRQLGFASAQEAKRQAYFGMGSSDMVVWLEGTDCRGSELELRYCSHPEWGSPYCPHSNDAGVVCSNSLASEGDVRLVDGSDIDEGRVEIYHNNQWGTICNHFWGYEEAEVVCRHLGFSGVYLNLTSRYGPGHDPIHLDNVVCSGYESSLLNCSHNDWGNHDCNHDEDVGIVCTQNTEIPDHAINHVLPGWAIVLIVLGSVFAL